jgi:hypothetical protein
MKSYKIIESKQACPNWIPMPYTHGDWFIQKLLDCGFWWEINEKPHFKLRSGDFEVIISPYPNVVTVDEYVRGMKREVYCHSFIPTNDVEFDEFWNNLKLYI